MFAFTLRSRSTTLGQCRLPRSTIDFPHFPQISQFPALQPLTSRPLPCTIFPMTTHTAPTLGDDFLDSRDVISRIADLTEQLAGELNEYDDRDELTQELTDLTALAEQGESLDDWTYGVQLILDSYFQEYAEQFADDIGAIDRNASWPLTHIDWEAAARDLQSDYTAIEVAGYTYWAR